MAKKLRPQAVIIPALDVLTSAPTGPVTIDSFPAAVAVAEPPVDEELPIADSPPIVAAQLTACRKCGSTERTKYTNRREIAFDGMRDGQPYTDIVWRNTSCVACGQVRVDQTFENRVAAAD